MAQRRMFNMKIVDSDAFMDMPQSSQLLYFQLAMRADDDGFVGNPKKIMRMVGSSDDDYKILVVKRFILVFPSGICVIKHWLIHNYIAKDRYNETVYVDEKSTIHQKENGSYTECIQNVDTVKVSIGKESIVKINEDIAADAAELPNWLNLEVWGMWVSFRKEKKQALKPSTIKLQLKFLAKYQSQHVEIIEHSIRQGYTGLFEPKGSYVPPKPTNVLSTSHTKTLADKMEESANKNR